MRLSGLICRAGFNPEIKTRGVSYRDGDEASKFGATCQLTDPIFTTEMPNNAQVIPGDPGRGGASST